MMVEKIFFCAAAAVKNLSLALASLSAVVGMRIL